MQTSTILPADWALPREEVSVAAQPLPVVPGALGRTLLLLEFLALFQYWTIPAIFPGWNYAGTWSIVGYVLFAALLPTLVLTVLWPLRRHLAIALATRRARGAFLALSAGAVLLGLFATNALQVVDFGPVTSSYVSFDPVYTPFGAWPNLAAYWSYGHLFATVNPAGTAMIAVLSIVWASAMALGFYRSRTGCPVPTRSTGGRWGVGAATIAAWGPVAFISGCSSCLPLFVAGLGLLAPGAATSLYALSPFVPWIGLSGLLFLLSLGVTLVILYRVTRPPPSRIPGSAEGGEPAVL